MSSPVIIVTGASRGIGLATVNFLLSQSSSPVNVLAIARSSSALQNISSSSPDPSRIETLTGDLCGDYNSVAKKAFQLCRERWGRVDGLVLNHGTLDPVLKVADAPEGSWEDAFKTNFFSCVAFIREGLEMLKKSQGRVVMVSSGAANNAYTGWGAYGASKAAMNHLNMTLATEEPDITTIALRPGVVDTAMQAAIREKHSKGMKEDEHANFIQLKESGSLRKPEEVGAVLGNLAIKAPKDLSGRYISITEDVLDPFRG